MPAHNPPNPDVDGCFEITLARSLARKRQRLQVQEAISRHGSRLSRLSPYKRVELAAALQWEFRRRVSWIKHDEGSLQTLEHQYKQVRGFVVPIYHLPAEILTDIFTIDFERDQSPIRLMLVCRDWYLVVEAMASMWKSIKLGTWTAPNRVERFLQKVWWLNVVIHTEEDVERSEGDSEAHTALALVAAKASRWRRLTIDSLPPGNLVPSLVDFPPITGLKYLRVASQAKSSHLLDPILENIGTAAVGSLTVMEITSQQTIRHLLQPAYAQLFYFLTTLKVDIRTIPDSVDLLPHLLRIEVLDLTNISLPLYADDVDLPLIHSLRHLRLKAVPIQWMGGRNFPQLQSCLINSPPSYPPLLSDVYFPICEELEFGYRTMEVAGQFRAPAIHSMTMKSHEWTPARGSKQVILLCKAGLGIHWQPRVLHLSVLCNEGVLLSVLELLPALNELQLDITRPCMLGRRFFMALLSKPLGDPKGGIDRNWGDDPPEHVKNWESRICPSLRRLELKYERWLRSTDQLDILPPLMAIGWSRGKSTTPLESFCLCFKGSDAQWKVLTLHSLYHLPDITTFDILQLQPFQKFHSFFNSCVIATATSVVHHAVDEDIEEDRLPDHFQHTLPLFEPYFRHLRVLRLYNPHGEYPTFDILPNFFRLEELELYSVDIPSYSINADLPLFQTLLRLSLSLTPLLWMDGRIFTRLKRLHLDTVLFGGAFSVSLPVCTHIKYAGGDHCPLQSIFRVSTLIELDRSNEPCCDLCWKSSGEKGLLPTRTLLLRDYICSEPESLVAGIASLVELEVLMIKSNQPKRIIALLTVLGRTIADVPATRSAFVTFDRNAVDGEYGGDAGSLSGAARSLICPDLTQLALRIRGASASEREEMRGQCEQVVDVRRRAGQELKYCRIYWDEDNTPSLVWGTSSDSVETEW